MVIKNKDGSIYKIQQPNPIMQKQSIWKEEDTILHNFNKSTLQEYKSIVAHEHKPIIQEPIIKNKSNDVIEEIKEIITSKKFYCLPAEVKVIVDKLYGETKKDIKYNKPFKFEANIVSKNDLSLVVWTKHYVGPMSIIYNEDWWKVIENNEDNDGYILNCMVSDIQPDFT